MANYEKTVISQRPDLCGITRPCFLDNSKLSKELKKVMKRAKYSGNAKRFIIDENGNEIQVPLDMKIKKKKKGV